MVTKTRPKPNPYVGPRAFETGEPIFGRDRELRQLFQLLVARRIVLLHAPSGAGKTSLVQAGLIPKLIEDGFEVLPVARLNLEPHLTQVEEGQYNRYIYSLMQSLEEDLSEDLKTPVEKLDSLPLTDYLSARDRDKDEERLPVLVIDQVEEVLTIDPTDMDQKMAFFAHLGAALRNPHMWALFVIREDYLGAIEPYLRAVPTRLANRYRLDLLGTEPAMQAIRKPAERQQVDFHIDAADGLIEDLRKVRIQLVDGVSETLGPFVEPVQLQVVCSNLWEAPRPESDRITREDVEQWGGVENALVNYYDSRLGEIAHLSEVSENNLRNWVETSLISESGLRNQVLAGQEKKVGLNKKAVHGLINSYLVREERRSGRVWYELSHDRLVEPIRKANADWRKDNVSPFRKHTIRWTEQGYPSSLLLLGSSLKDAQDWAAERPNRITPEEQSYLDQSQLQQETNLRAVRAELGIDLEKRGWGIIFAASASIEPPEREALLPLLQRRQEQAGALYREFIAEKGYRSGESARNFLGRYGVGYGPADPAIMPYYLLIIGDPQTIPYEFQYDLGVQFAVGRLDFPTLEEYHNYARSVVLCETLHEAGEFILPESINFFAPAHPDDPATEMSLNKMMLPLAEQLGEQRPHAQVETIYQERATKACLSQLLSETNAPAAFFFAGHILEFKRADPFQLQYTGSLLCQDWPGPMEWRDIVRNSKENISDILLRYSLSVSDIPDHASLLGMVAILFGGPTAGCPQFDNFPFHSSEVREIAPYPFTTRLTQRLLGLPAGGAQAIIGHIDRAWGASFYDQKIGKSDLVVFENVIRKLLAGQTVGLAMEDFAQRYTLLASALTEMLLSQTLSQKELKPDEVIKAQIAAIDARNYILLGDPAVRLPLGSSVQLKPSSSWQRPNLPQVEIPDVWKQALSKTPPPSHEQIDQPDDVSY